MPELPDVVVYCESIERFFLGERLRALRIASPFLLRTFDPLPSELAGLSLREVRHIGKRIALGFGHEEGPLAEAAPPPMWCVVHLMIAGRFRLRDLGSPLPKKLGQCALDFESGSLLLTEAGSKKRASVSLFRSWEEARQLDRGGTEPLRCTFAEFRDALSMENRTLKRALTDPRLLSGIGNAFSDEILFWAQLSPVARTQSLERQAWERLFVATRHTLLAWVELLRRQTGQGFPEKVTAFREEMAVHGRFKRPCRVCSAPIQRIAYANNETNYCPRCQTGGRVLADRALSRLLRSDWPRSIEELEDKPHLR